MGVSVTASILATWIGIGFTLLMALCGGTWWLATMAGKISVLRRDHNNLCEWLEKYKEEDHKEKDKMWDKIHNKADK